MEIQGDKSIIIGQMHDMLSTLPSLRIAYVYGSFLSRDDFRDIDIALLLDGQPDGDFIQRYAASVGDHLEEALEFLHECDVKVLDDLPVWLKFEIISTGTPLYVRNDEDRIDYETQVLVEYQDVKSMYDLFDREYLAQA
jgi:uncharacterized protein